MTEQFANKEEYVARHFASKYPELKSRTYGNEVIFYKEKVSPLEYKKIIGRLYWLIGGEVEIINVLRVFYYGSGATGIDVYDRDYMPLAYEIAEKLKMNIKKKFEPLPSELGLE